MSVLKPIFSHNANHTKKPDIGLPVYRPDIGPPMAKYRGTRLATHTFPPQFLPKLLAVGRKHGVKLAAVLHAALLQAVHETTDDAPGADDLYKSGSALDLRNGWLLSPYCERKQYVNSAIAIHPIEVPCSIFDRENGYWEAAAYISDLWEIIKKKKAMVKTMESDSAAFVESWGKGRSVFSSCLTVHVKLTLNVSSSSGGAATTTKPRTCPYFVSDPPGSQLLNTVFPVSGYEDLQFILDSYQLATDQNQAVM